MKYNDLKNIILSSNREDWLFNDERGIYTYKNDLNIWIQRKDIDFDRDKFVGEDWATKHPDPNAYREIYEIYYSSSFIEEKMLVSVDGFRASLPLPKIGTNKVKNEDYQFAKIVDQINSLDEYMDRAQLEIEDV
jgi:hypothetical protein